MAHIIDCLKVYILRAQITTRLNQILNSDWLHALTHFSPNSGVLVKSIAYGAIRVLEKSIAHGAIRNGSN
ncbi:hypothetical protein BLOT_015599 [Blomia tropicalis]|nr:hypothetical protein BLOT_015599 [Blomia tropicalis]